MDTIFEYHDITASERLETLVNEKLEHLGEKYPFVHRADVFFKKENRSDEKEKICDIRLSMPGPRIFASSNEVNFEAAIAETFRDLNSQLEKKKDKMNPRK